MTDIDHDAELVARAQADPEAFGALYERYVKKIYNYLYYRTGNTHDAEDLTERVFQKAMMNLHRYTSRGLLFSAWLYRIAHNLLANWHRDRGRRQTVAFNELAQAILVECAAVGRERRDGDPKNAGVAIVG